MSLFFTQLPNTIQYLRKYLQAEYKEKKGGTFDLSDWVDYYDPVSTEEPVRGAYGWWMYTDSR